MRECDRLAARILNMVVRAVIALGHPGRVENHRNWGEQGA